MIKRAEELADELLALTVPDMDLNGEVRAEDLPGEEELQAELEAQYLEAQRQAVNRVFGSNLLAARARKQFKMVR